MCSVIAQHLSYSYILQIYYTDEKFDFQASIAGSESEAIPKSDVTPAGEETLDFDDDTSKG